MMSFSRKMNASPKGELNTKTKSIFYHKCHLKPREDRPEADNLN